MAVHDEEGSNAGNEPTQQREHPSREGVRPTRNTQRDDDRDDATAPRYSLRNLNTALPRPFGRNETGQTLVKALESFHALFQTAPGSEADLSNYNVIGFDTNEQRAGMSAVLLVAPLEADGKTYLFNFTLMLEASAPVLTPLKGEFEGRHFDIIQVAGDLFNEKYLSRVEDLVTRRFKSSRSNDVFEFVDCGHAVIQASVDLSDQAVLKTYAFYGTAAISTVSGELLGNAPEFELSWITENDKLILATEFNPEPIRNAAGQPRRTDAKLTLIANINDDDDKYQETLAVVGVQLEAVYAPSRKEDEDSRGFRRRSVEKQTLVAPLASITTLDTGTKAVTLELMLSGLVAVASLSDDLFWLNGFRGDPLVDPKDVDPRDPGAFGYLDDGVKIDTKANSFDNEKLLGLFEDYCSPELAFALHCEEAGELSWLTDVFRNAAGTGPFAKEMRQLLTDTADHVTDGHYSTRLAEEDEKELVVNGDNRIILGTYKDEHGELRDLRDFDLLKFLNQYGHNDPELALQYQDTFDMTNLPIDYRIDQRIRILSDVLGNRMKITGFARQVYLTAGGMRALALAFEDCGLEIERASGGQSYTNTRQRGNTLVGRMGGSNMGAGLFNSYSRRDDRSDRGDSRGTGYSGRTRHWSRR